MSGEYMHDGGMIGRDRGVRACSGEREEGSEGVMTDDE